MQKGTNQITVNAVDLKIPSVHFKSDSGDKVLSAQKIEFNDQRETATFTFDEILPVGPATVKIAFEGILDDKMKGYLPPPSLAYDHCMY